jgi:hypothetical protein
VPRPKPYAHLLELTKRGAQAQLNDLLHEVQMLFELFPHLRDSVDSDDLPVNFLLKRGNRSRLLTKPERPVKGREKGSQAGKRAVKKR